jgi:N-acetylglucosamine-6-sulfatase
MPLPFQVGRLALACWGFAAMVILFANTTAAEARSNVVLIQTDDQTLEQLYARDREGRLIMPNVVRNIGRDGVTFDRYYVTYPICCPSRASLLTGLYVHNHRVLINRPPFGYPAFRRSPAFGYNLATWLQGAGYETIHVGKFMNFYGDADPSEVPPGWSDWETVISGEGARRYYGASYDINGALVGPLGDWNGLIPDPADCLIAVPLSGGACNYSTDVDTALAVNAVLDHSGRHRPFYLQVDYTAPHMDLIEPLGPAVAPRDEGSARGVRHRPPGYDEADISDKPLFLRGYRRLSDAQRADIDQRYRRELESLRAVDDGVGRIVDALAASGQLQNTYIFFVSDNGQFHGEHRIAQGKYLPYEPASHMPLLVRGPGIAPGSRSSALVANIDIAPTVARIAGVEPRADGRSILQFARNPNLRSSRPILLEGYSMPSTGAFPNNNAAAVLDYFGVLAGRFKYIHYAYGDRELYDLDRDPHELHSFATDPRYIGVVRRAQQLIDHLKTCRYRGCNLYLRRQHSLRVVP